MQDYVEMNSITPNDPEQMIKIIEKMQKRITELETKIDLVTAHSNDLEDQTRQAFSRVIKLLDRLSEATCSISETYVSELEERVFDED